MRRILAIGDRALVRRVSAVAAFLLPLLCSKDLSAQVDLRISPTESDFTIASPMLCGSTQVSAQSKELARLIAADLSITGLYRVLGPKELPEPIGSCVDANGGAFPRDLPERKINQFVTGQLRAADGKA